MHVVTLSNWRLNGGFGIYSKILLLRPFLVQSKSGLNSGAVFIMQIEHPSNPVSILRKSISGRHRPVRVADGPMTARCRFT